jgi:RNA polymerase subunit RPABC4/transcription elongation factor Spt4
MVKTYVLKAETLQFKQYNMCPYRGKPKASSTWVPTLAVLLWSEKRRIEKKHGIMAINTDLLMVRKKTSTCTSVHHALTRCLHALNIDQWNCYVGPSAMQRLFFWWITLFRLLIWGKKKRCILSPLLSAAASVIV